METGGRALIASGSFAPLGTSAGPARAIDGVARADAFGTSTAVTVTVEGLDPAYPTYPAHVHNAACADGAGGHYQVNPTAPPGQDNEIWPTIHNQGTSGTGFAEVHGLLRPDARSVVIHDPKTGAKLSCADLRLDEAFGALADLPAGRDAGIAIHGWAALREVGPSTIAELVVYGGLQPSTAYPAHVHAAACADGAGAHYEIDPGAPAGEANEVWLNFTTDAHGGGGAQVTVPARIRLDARSVVIHDPATKVKLICADLR